MRILQSAATLVLVVLCANINSSCANEAPESTAGQVQSSSRPLKSAGSDPIGAIYAVPGLDDALVRLRPTSVKEDDALRAAASEFMSGAAEPRNDARSLMAPFEHFLLEHPDSGWNAAIRTNLGLAYYRHGYFTRALEALQEAWSAGKAAKDPLARLIVDKALAQLARMHARIGHAAAVETLAEEAAGRSLDPSSRETFVQANEGAWMMKNSPGLSFLCGPKAVRNVAQALGEAPSKFAPLDEARSGPKGFTLRELHTLSAKTVPMRMVKRMPDQEVPVPSVAHWKVDHFAAIVAKREDGYLLKDPTFGADLVISQAAIDEESSGYFLVPEQSPQDKRWAGVSALEAENIVGRGFIAMPEPGSTGPDRPKLADSNDHQPPGQAPPLRPRRTPPTDRQCMGMCRVNAHIMNVSANIVDTPVGYAPPRGPAVFVPLTYNQREEPDTVLPTRYGIGSQWSLGVLSSLRDDLGLPGSSVVRHQPGGGHVAYDASQYNTSTGIFAPERLSGAVLARVPATGPATSYTLTSPDGSKLVYALSDGATTGLRKMWLTQIVDAWGQRLLLNYEWVTVSPGFNAQRLVSVTDAVGRNTTFSYALPAYPLLITKITDPFGRSADLAYDAAGRLLSTTDPVSVFSKFTYIDGRIATVETPYGTTTITSGEGGSQDLYSNATYKRWLSITDPEGGTKRIEFRIDEAAAASDWEQIRPTGISTANSDALEDPRYPDYHKDYLRYRNTFYWDESAYQNSTKDATGSPTEVWRADIYHWLHTSSGQVSTILESIKKPQQNRLWYNYAGQPSPVTDGFIARPSSVGRLLGDNSTQLRQTSYDATQNLTITTDPLGRVTRYTWLPGGRLQRVEQKVAADGTYNTIESYFYSGTNPLPSQVVRPDGRTWYYAYNAAGQILEIRNPSNVIDTSFSYDAKGRLTGVVNANGITTKGLSYPVDCDTVNPSHLNCDLPSTVTDSEGHSVSYAYDGLDRQLSQTFPNGTSETWSYTRLDLTSTKNRRNYVTQYTYDKNGRLVTIKDPVPANPPTTLTYYANNKLATLTNGNGSVTRWFYDYAGRKQLRYYDYQQGTQGTQVNNKTQYDYEIGTNRPIRRIGGHSPMQEVLYNKDDTVKEVKYYNPSLSSSSGFSFTYDPYFPRLTSTSTIGTNGAVSDFRTFAYKPLGADGAMRIASEVGIFVGTGDDVTYGYDSYGRLSNRSLGTLNEQWTFDILSRVSTHVTGLGTFTYLYLGQTSQVASRTLSGGTAQTTYAYAPNTNDRRLLSITNLGGGRSYTLSPQLDPYNERQIKETTGSTTTRHVTYQYDENNRLASEYRVIPSPSGSTFFTFDSAYNMQGVVPSMLYNANNQLYSDNSATYAYDGFGRRTSGGPVASYQWGDDGNLTSLSPAPAGVSQVSYSYDAQGRRSRMTFGAPGTPAVHTLMWCGGRLCGINNGATTIARFYDEGELRPASSSKLVYLKDSVGSVRDVVNATTGALVNSYDYALYGQQTAGLTGTQTYFKFAGMFQENVVAPYMTTTRIYDRYTGQFLSRDSMEERGGFNLYAYADGNPISKSDPEGTAPVCNYSSLPILGTGSVGDGPHGHPTNKNDKEKQGYGIIEPGQCVSSDTPLHTSQGDVRDVDALDFNQDGYVKFPDDGGDYYGGGKIPGGEDFGWKAYPWEPACFVIDNPFPWLWNTPNGWFPFPAFLKFW
jgi:RHS repeat-associated protein